MSVMFRGRLVADHYPNTHAHAQTVGTYDDFADGVPRDRIKYGDPKDRYPGGITYATYEERLVARIALATKLYGRATDEVVERIKSRLATEEIRTDHRCADCDVEVGEFHLPGCDIERCPCCEAQAISCGCKSEEEDT